MQLTTVHQSITDVAADAIVVNLFEGVTHPGGATGAVDRVTGGLIRKLIESGGFKGKKGECATLHFPPGLSQRSVIIVGLGPANDFSLDRVREVTAASLKEAARIGPAGVATIVHGAGIGGLETGAAAQAVAEGALLGTYRYTRFKQEPDENASKS